MVLRQRKGGSKSLDKVVQELDAFPKVPEHYVEQTASGASISVVTFFLVAWLIWSEAQYFLNPGYKFRFTTDGDLESKLSINVDLTVAMPCDLIGADILDSTNQNTFSFGRLKEDPTWFELDHIQRKHFDAIQTFNGYLREEFHAVQDLLWRSGLGNLYGSLPERRVHPEEPHDACRIHGSLRLNKVSGNFHITAGKSVPLMRGHAHLTQFMGPQDYNFSHRVEKFSFGEGYGSIVQPLEGEEKIAPANLMNYQYFIEVVPTDNQAVSGFTRSTYQYSVKDQERPIDHDTGSHGSPGIYFKYDVSALKVIASQDREPLAQFLVRLCAAVGGLVATSQLLCGLLKSAIDFYCCRRELSAGMVSSNHHGGPSPASQPQPQQTADLFAPGERVKKPAAAGAAPSQVMREQQKSSGQAVTLEEAEKLIKMGNS